MRLEPRHCPGILLKDRQEDGLWRAAPPPLKKTERLCDAFCGGARRGGGSGLLAFPYHLPPSGDQSQLRMMLTGNTKVKNNMSVWAPYSQEGNLRKTKEPSLKCRQRWGSSGCLGWD